MGRLPAAVEAFERVIELEPSNMAAWTLRGICQRGARRVRCEMGITRPRTAILKVTTVAMSAVDAAKHWGGSIEVAKLALEASLLTEQGALPVAIERLRELSEQAPEFAWAWRSRARCQQFLRRFDDAIECYARAFDLAENAEDLEGLGHCELAKGEVEEALRTFGRAIARSPSLADAWYGRSLAFEAAGNSAAALRAYDRFIELAAANASERAARGLARDVDARSSSARRRARSTDSHADDSSSPPTLRATLGRWTPARRFSRRRRWRRFPLNENFGLCRGRVCVGRRWIHQADPASFAVIDGHYASDEANIYFGSGSYWRVVNAPMHWRVEVENVVDRESFEVIGSEFARDRARVYWTCDVLFGLDPDDFVLLSAHFARTPASVLYFYSGIHRSVVDDDGRYVGIAPIALPGADPESFSPLVELYGADASALYYHSSAVSGCDPTGAEVLDRDIVVCGSAVVFRGDVVPGADPRTFELLAGSPFRRDKNAVYRRCGDDDNDWIEIVAGADPSTFEVALPVDPTTADADGSD